MEAYIGYSSSSSSSSSHNNVEASGSSNNNHASSSSKARTSFGDTATVKPEGTRETRIEDFDVLKTIGTGTFARVYLCRFV